MLDREEYHSVHWIILPSNVLGLQQPLNIRGKKVKTQSHMKTEGENDFKYLGTEGMNPLPIYSLSKSTRCSMAQSTSYKGYVSVIAVRLITRASSF